jgi:flagellar protein FlgJ
MSFSMDGISSYLDTTAANASSSARASSATSALSGLSSSSSEEDLTEAVESFEAYLVEQVIKEVKETLTSDDEDEDSTMSQYKDMYMDVTIQQVAEEMVSQYGGTVTQDLVDQMKRNYGIE